MRRGLRLLYSASGWGGAAALASMCVLIIFQIVGRFFGYAVPHAELSIYFLGLSTFLALAYTLHQEEHIRVNIILNRSRGLVRRILEILSAAVAFLIVLFILYFWFLMTYESWWFQRMSPGIISIPIWIPQFLCGLGLLIFAISLLDRIWIIARDRTSA